ncbi:thioredoxin family protein [Flavihumibacter sp. ZG627]|uniref:thioredoxin family protein n=1 Tax=Flavihumibacter sp. ZG627 TaxID=1463156 RepID=UPI0005802FF6|nr:thioredoxin family protein [Flavihumibacter sp. ZG627]KIC90130.1 thiol-disulfide isomerase [Flavihumibacter sp. ZG627]
MKKLLMLAAIAISAFAFTMQQGSLPIGSDIPKADIKMKDVSGKILSLADIKTPNGLLVMFSCNTCPYVLKNQERTRGISKYALEKNIGVILLNSNEGDRSKADSYNAMQAYAKKQGYNWPYAIDSNNELADAFGAARTPEVFLFNGDGKLVYHGAIDDSPADESKISRIHLREAINETIAGKDVSVKETRSVGCGIKRKS